MSTVRQDLTSNSSEFQVCAAATEKDRRANSVRILETFSSGASDDRRGQTGTYGSLMILVTQYTFKGPSPTNHLCTIG